MGNLPSTAATNPNYFRTERSYHHLEVLLGLQLLLLEVGQDTLLVSQSRRAAQLMCRCNTLASLIRKEEFQSTNHQHKKYHHRAKQRRDHRQQPSVVISFSFSGIGTTTRET